MLPRLTREVIYTVISNIGSSASTVTMRAIVHTGSESIELQDRERSSPDPTEVLVQVHTAGLCGSDAHAYLYEEGYEWIKMPRIVGHEYSGTVVEVGKEVTEFKPGDKVIEQPIHGCGECFQCLNGQMNVCQNFTITGMHVDGAWADYTVVDPAHLHAVPDDVPLEHAAITEPTSVVTRAVLTQSTVTPGDNVLVEGPGPIGALTAMVADSIGANVLVSGLDRDEEVRFPILEETGLETVNAQSGDLAGRREKFTDGVDFDVVFDTTGHHSGVETAAEQVRKGGQIVIVGIPGESSDLLLTPIVRGEIDVNTSYGSDWRNFEQALRLMENDSIDPRVLIDTDYDIHEPSRAFEAFLNSQTLKPVFSFADS